LKRFLEIVESEGAALAVHCKAGLGRTGTLISLYLMKWYGVTTPEVISWLRLCRPGSVIGPQQNFLAEMETRMHAEGERHKKILAQQQAAAGSPAPPSDMAVDGMSSHLDNCSVSSGSSSGGRGAPGYGSPGAKPNGTPSSPNAIRPPVAGKGFAAATAPSPARGNTTPSSPNTNARNSPLKKLASPLKR